VAIPVGTKFGPYEILGLIGAGGMGEVHRARDTRLGREVAIKTLPPGLSDQPERLRRFETEARAASLLSHPNILTVHDIGTADGQPYIVSELLEGENLRERLTRGPLPPRKSVEIAAAIADALAAAHARGIVHRDLKPENLYLTRDGRVKVLDFGIAKLTVSESEHPAGAPTVTILTDVGVAVGTLGYMAPEQVRGELADHRSDIFALGAILHEMIAGTPAFRRDSRIATVNAVLESELPELSGDVAPAIRQIVRRCVEKEPDNRFQSARDLAFALSSLSGALPTTTGARQVRSRSRAANWRVTATVALISATLAGGLAWRLRPAVDATPRVVRSTLTLPPGVAAAIGGAVAFAPDGASVVYVGAQGGRQQLYRHRLDESVARPVADTDNADSPFFSPDGRWIGFATPGHLKKVPVDGGSSSIICKIQSFFGASWGEDGNILFSHIPESGIFRVSSSGGTPEMITTLSPDDAGNDHRHPQLLAGGRALLFAVATGPEDSARIVVSDLQTGARKEIVRGAAAARFVSPDKLAYVRNGELFIAPFSVDRLETTGPPQRIASGVAEGSNGGPEYSFSESGDLVYIPGQSGGRQNRLAFVDLQGNVSPTSVPPMSIWSPRISPDGRFVAFFIGAAKNNVWVFDRERDTTTRVTFGRFHDAVWLGNGRLTMAEGGPGAKRLVIRSVNGSGGSDPLTDVAPDHFPESWSPDGQTLVYRQMHADGHWDLWSVRASDRSRTAVLTSPFNESNARFSPDGRWIVYASDETGRSEIYARSADTQSGRWPVSTNGGTIAVWAPDGRRIYYRASDGIWTVNVAPGSQFAVSRPQHLFATPGFSALFFDITPDGRRFVMVQSDPTPLPDKLHLVMTLLAPHRR
jgi:eukaryotic-like serine/threonine-protein kinase